MCVHRKYINSTYIFSYRGPDNQKSPPILSLHKGSSGVASDSESIICFSLILVPKKTVSHELESKRPQKCNFLFISFPLNSDLGKGPLVPSDEETEPMSGLRSSDWIWLQVFGEARGGNRQQSGTTLWGAPLFLSWNSHWIVLGQTCQRRDRFPEEI